MTKYDFNMARPLGSDGPWERVIDTDCLHDWATGKPIGLDDMFKLEFSNWTRYVEFKPIGEG